MKNIVSMAWLANHLNDADIIIVDCRFVLADPESGRRSYDQGHVPGAVYFDLERDLSGPKSMHGGRHPLPNMKIFADKLGEAGIDETIKVVAYDDQNGAMASRFWWMLKYLGHSHAYLLDGNFSQWKIQGHPVTEQLPQNHSQNKTADNRAQNNTLDNRARIYTPQIQPHLLATMQIGHLIALHIMKKPTKVGG